MAQVENRLRQASLDLVEPTIHKCAILQEDLDALKERVTSHAKGINEVSQMQIKAHEHVTMIDHFKEEMNKWESQHKQNEAKVGEDVVLLRQELDRFDYQVKQKESALNSLNRGAVQMTQELNRLLKNQAELQQQCHERLDQLSRKIANVHTDLEVKINRLETKHNSLTDDLWGDETGLAKVSGELNRTNAQVHQLNNVMSQLTESKAPREDLEKLHEEVHTVLREANGSMLGLKRVVGNVVNDVKEHFRTSSNTIAAHNSTFIEEMRRSYEKEQEAMELLREEVNTFLSKTRTDNQTLTTQVEEGVQRMDSLVAEMRGDMEELNKKRKRDKTSQDIELKGMKKRLGGVFDHSDVVLRGMEHLNGVLHLVLESERVQAALEFQDNIDRNKIALVGVKDDEQMKDSLDIPQELRRGGTRGTVRAGRTGALPPGEVMSVDTRCISCSGQAPTVMSAFKMACLKYSPSPVEYEMQTHNRQDLILRRQKLLEHAMRALAEGAAQTLEAASGVAGDLEFSTPGGRGGARGTIVPGAASQNSTGSAFRPTATTRTAVQNDAPLGGYAAFAGGGGITVGGNSGGNLGTTSEFTVGMTGNLEKDARAGVGRQSVKPSPRQTKVVSRKSVLPGILSP